MTKQVRQAIVPTHILGSTGTDAGCSLGHRSLAAFKGDIALDPLVTTCDATIHGVKVGRGGGSCTTNTAVGAGALAANTTGVCNTAYGANALCENTTGAGNTATGCSSLSFNTSGCFNTASGLGALRANTTGCFNTASGLNAMCANTTGSSNTASGLNALCVNTTGSFSTAIGSSAARNSTASNNTAIGAAALFCTTTGSNNIGVGLDAGRTGCSPLAITTASNQVVIGNNNHNCFVARCAWLTSSDCRDKTDVAPTIYGLGFVRALEPVEYKWDSRHRYGYDENTGQFGTPDGSQKDAHCSIGFMAQQVIALEKKEAPGRKPIIVSEDDPTSLLLAETRIIPALVKSIQELAARVEALEIA